MENFRLFGNYFTEKLIVLVLSEDKIYPETEVIVKLIVLVADCLLTLVAKQ